MESHLKDRDSLLKGDCEGQFSEYSCKSDLRSTIAIFIAHHIVIMALKTSLVDKGGPELSNSSLVNTLRPRKGRYALILSWILMTNQFLL